MQKMQTGVSQASPYIRMLQQYTKRSTAFTCATGRADRVAPVQCFEPGGEIPAARHPRAHAMVLPAGDQAAGEAVLSAYRPDVSLLDAVSIVVNFHLLQS